MKNLQRNAKPLMWFSALLITILVAGCGADNSDTTPPTITSTVAASGATNVSTTAPVSAVFSRRWIKAQ